MAENIDPSTEKKNEGVLSEEDILAKVIQKSKDCVGWYDSRISKERMRVIEYYNGVLPRRQHDGASSYISTDVYDSVEMMKAQLLEVFSGGDEIAVFDPDTAMDIELCREATEACRFVIFRENPGVTIFNHIIHDGLCARVGVAKVYWDERFEYEDQEFHNLPEPMVRALAAQEDVEDFEAEEIIPNSGLFKGKFQKKIDRSKVRIDLCAPEEFLIEPRAVMLPQRDGSGATYCGHRCLKTKAELKAMGLNPSKVDVVHYDDARGLDLSPEVLARNQPVETLQALNNAIQPEMEQVMLYESYVRMVIDRRKGARLYKILHVDSTLFEYEEVDDTPFICYVPLPVPHLFYGNNYAQRVIPFQNARTVLTRAVLDHAATTVNPRWAVVQGGLVNPREMIDNRLGGLINVRRPDSVSALEVPNLNPFVFQVLGMLKDDKEQSTGISSLMQGLNKDAISSQNSQGLVEDLVTLSGQRQKIAARHFVQQFFVPLMLKVMRLLVLNENQKKIIEVAGQWKMVDPSRWTERYGCTVSMHLGYGERDTAVAKHQQLYKELAGDPGLGGMFGQQQRYSLAMDSMRIAGFPNRAAYLGAPSQQTQPQPDPLKTKELQIKDKAADAAMLTAKTRASHDAILSQIDQKKVELERLHLLLDAHEKDRTHNRQDTETAHRINIGQREMKLEEQARPHEVAAQHKSANAQHRALALDEQIRPAETAIKLMQANQPTSTG